MTDVDPTRAEKKKKCVVCAGEIPADDKICPGCNRNPDGQQCDNCKKRMPAEARFCNECKSYQSWRWYFSVAAFSLLAGVITAVQGLHLGATYLSELDSHTKFKVSSADERHLYLRVWNTGRKPSVLVAYHLHFNGNPPLKDATLQLSDENAAEARNVIVSGSPVKIELTMGSDSLEILPDAGNNQNTKARITPGLGSQSVVLDVDVEESDDPSEGFRPWITPRKFHTRRDAFSIDRIKPFIVWNMR
jgi:hypothetical protein